MNSTLLNERGGPREKAAPMLKESHPQDTSQPQNGKVIAMPATPTIAMIIAAKKAKAAHVTHAEATVEPGTTQAAVSLFDRKISYYDSAKDVAPSRAITIREFYRMVYDGETAAAVARVRAAASEDEKRAAKMRLPAVQLSGHVTVGNRAKAMEEGRFAHSGVLQLDIDGDGLNGKTPEEARAMLGSDPHVLSAFIGPSGQGVKALFRIRPCATTDEHKATFAAVERYILETYGFKIDPATKDPGRLCYLPSDSDCTWNGSAVEFVIPESPALKSSTAPLVIRSARFPEPPEHGIHDPWLPRAARWCESNGLSEAEAVAKLYSYEGRLRRKFSRNEPEDACRLVYSTPLEPQAKPRVQALNGRPAIELPCPGRPLTSVFCVCWPCAG